MLDPVKWLDFSGGFTIYLDRIKILFDVGAEPGSQCFVTGHKLLAYNITKIALEK